MDDLDIFTAALELGTPEQRAKYLDQACKDNAALRERIEALLRSAEQVSRFMEPPSPPIAASPTLAPPITERPGDRIGPYKLLEQIGEGGMGVVYMAEQSEPVERRVALKIIKPGMDSRQVIARFEAERQALAMMDHPNIAKVLDAGATVSGRPFFVMELVKGVPIAEYCDQQQLSPRERLELFVPVCQAVQHAHQKGIIHRDLKPGNILVARYDDKAIPKVIDFGVAKAVSHKLTQKTMFTQFGQIVGTLEYMSPEQAQLNQLDVDTRSDIYSLGVLLYELLTGETPFDKQRLRSAAFDELLRIIREEEPPKPSVKLSTSVSLPSIAANRHIAPHKLSLLVRGELDWIVMKALEKDRTRRYETASAFVADVQHYLNDEPVVACPPSAAYRFRKFARRNQAGLATASLLAIVLLAAVCGVGWALRDRAAQRAEAARAQAARQERITAQVELLLSDVDRLAGEQQWEAALSTARRAEAVLTGNDIAGDLRDRVETAVKELTFVARLTAIRLDASLRWTNGEFDYAGAARSYGRTFREFGVDVEKLPAAEALARLQRHPRVALPTAIALDECVRQLRSADADGTSWRSLGDVARRLDPDPVRNRLRSMSGQEVTPEIQSELRELADSFDFQNQSAETANRLALKLGWAQLEEREEQFSRQALQVFPGDFWLNLNLGGRLDDPTECTRFASAALAINPNSAVAYNNVGVALSKQGKLEEAVACFRKAIDLDPKAGYFNLGLALRDQGKLEEAIACFRKDVELDPKSAGPHYNLGVALQKQGQMDEAIVCYRKAIELDPNYAHARNDLGVALQKQGQMEEAIACYHKAIELDPKFVPAHHNLGAALYKQGKPEEAVACFRKAIELDPRNTQIRYSLGQLLRSQNQTAEARAAFREVIALDDSNVPAYLQLAALLAADEAIACYKKVISIDPAHAQAHRCLGDILREKGDMTGAIAAYSKAIEASPDDSGPHNNLGLALLAEHRTSEAIVAFENAVALFRRMAREDPDDKTAKRNLTFSLTNLAKSHLAAGNDQAHQDACQSLVALFPPPAERTVADWGHLGQMLYRAGQYAEARLALEKVVELRRDKGPSLQSGPRWWYLAMTLAQVGERERAREIYEQLDRQVDQTKPLSESTRRLRVETAEVLGIEMNVD